MANIVITGGTDGIGRALATARLAHGDNVLIIGRDRTKATAITNLGERAHFLAADLSLISENQRVIDQVHERFAAIDLLVLGARYHRQHPVITPDGLEATFALFYLSRYILSHGLRDLLTAVPHSTILNFGAAWQINRVSWDDLQLRRDYHGVRAMGHAGHLNDLLAVDFTTRFPRTGIRYLVNHPGVVATSFAGDYDPATRHHIDQLRLVAKPVEAAVAHVLPHLEHSGTANTIFVFEGQQLSIPIGEPELADARRLAHLTQSLLPH